MRLGFNGVTTQTADLATDGRVDIAMVPIASIKKHRPADFSNCNDIVRILPLE